MKPFPHHILVIGCGSIGERHVRTFLATGRARVVACDNRPDICRRIGEKYPVRTAADWQQALADPALTGVVIATPAPHHVAMVLPVMAAKRHVLIEKPLAVGIAGVDQLAPTRDQTGRFAAVAYVQRCQPAMQSAREFLQSGVLGAIRHATVTTGQHFPTFRPAYREIYYRDHAQGGGAIQDALTHLANGIEWMLGPTSRVYCDAAHQVLAGVEVEDTVCVTARNGGALVNYALNQFQAPNENRWDFHGEHGSLRIELHAGRWGTLLRGESEWTWRSARVADRDTVFVVQAHAFLDGCEGKEQTLCTIEEGIQTLRFNLAALQSWREARPIDL
ncbi:MAG: Gfo/Idh/MocA family oxidoreductase [Opitutae bacterium]|nr:Gfo/Idh/MocA family oxidoreductase [Opitutae bacterium]